MVVVAVVAVVAVGAVVTVITVSTPRPYPATPQPSSIQCVFGQQTLKHAIPVTRDRDRTRDRARA